MTYISVKEREQTQYC